MLSHYVTGPLDGPPVVFLHGFLGCKEDWEETFSFLDTRFRLYAYDLPGHGESPIDAQIDVCAAPLIGYSMGGRIALGHPTQVPRLVISSHPGLKTTQEKELRWQRDLEWAHALRTLPFEIFLKLWYDQPLFASLKKRPDIFEKMITRRLSQNPDTLACALERFSLSKQNRVTDASFPICHLYGADDLKFSRLSYTLDPLIEVQSIQGCGHVIPYENPRELATRITSFLHRHSLSQR